MNELQFFVHEDFGQIRVVQQDSEPWFVAADVCRALDIGNPTDAINRLDNDEHTLVSIEGASNGRPVNAVNEPGLYTSVLGSRKPEAKAFKGGKAKMDKDTQKEFERLENEHTEMKAAAMRLIDFVFEDKKMKEMTPDHIKRIFDMAHGIIAKAAGTISLEQIYCIFTQKAKDSPQGQPACQESHSAS